MSGLAGVPTNSCSGRFDSEKYVDNAIKIVGIYQYKQYLSVVYEGIEESRLPGK